jgi:hypothetical protein
MTNYPFFHPDRPRFFNTATLFTAVIIQLYRGVRPLLSELSDSFFASVKTENDAQIGYKNYVRWEISGGKDLQLSANLLTNRQMYKCIGSQLLMQILQNIKKLLLKQFFGSFV